MNSFVLAVPVLIIAAYVALAVRLLPSAFSEGGSWRDQLRGIAQVGPGEILSVGWPSALLLLVGIGVLIAASVSFGDYLAYTSAPECGIAARPDCRALVDLQVSKVESQSSRSGQETVIDFVGRYGSATFWASDVPSSAVQPETTVTGEVWRGDVTALVLQGVRKHSFATQSDAWVGVAAGLGAALFGLTWLAIDVAIESQAARVYPVRETFQSPAGRRIALYVLLPLFGLLLMVFGAAYMAIALGAFDTANTLATVYAVGAVLGLPVLIGVFVAWFYRAYMNVHALGLRCRHSGWFVAAALLVPPLSLYMPYRLAREVALVTRAQMPGAWLKAWWICAVGWLGCTIVGLTIGSPDPRDASLSNQISNGLLVASVVLGLIGAGMTIRLVGAVDAAELSITSGH